MTEIETERGETEILRDNDVEVRRDRVREERQEIQCYGCGAPLWHPYRMEKCRHVICMGCYQVSSKYIPNECMVCRGKTKCSYDAVHQEKISGIAQCSARDAEIEAIKAQQEGGVRVIIEYGNTAVGDPGSAYTVEAYAKCTKLEKGAGYKGKPPPAPSRALTRVDFNINPSFPKAAIKVMQAPFTLSRTMQIKFCCELTFHVPGAAEIIVPYYMHHEAKTTRKIVVVLPNGAEGTGVRKPKPIKVFDYGWGEEDPEPPSCAVVRAE